MKILGLHHGGHDTAASITLIVVSQHVKERYNRKAY